MARKKYCHVVSQLLTRRVALALISLAAQLVLVSRAPAQSPTYRWATKSGGPANDYGYGIAVDGGGNSYVAGSFNSSATFGANNVTSSGGDDIFIAKFDSAGNPVWVRNAGGITNDAANAVAVDEIGRAHV